MTQQAMADLGGPDGVARQLRLRRRLSGFMVADRICMQWCKRRVRRRAPGAKRASAPGAKRASKTIWRAAWIISGSTTSSFRHTPPMRFVAFRASWPCLTVLRGSKLRTSLRITSREGRRYQSSRRGSGVCTCGINSRPVGWPTRHAPSFGDALRAVIARTGTALCSPSTCTISWWSSMPSSKFGCARVCCRGRLYVPVLPVGASGISAGQTPRRETARLCGLAFQLSGARAARCAGGPWCVRAFSQYYSSNYVYIDGTGSTTRYA